MGGLPALAGKLLFGSALPRLELRGRVFTGSASALASRNPPPRELISACAAALRSLFDLLRGSSFYGRTSRARGEAMLWERVVGFRVRHNMPLASANDLHQALAREFHLAGFSAPRATRV